MTENPTALPTPVTAPSATPVAARPSATGTALPPTADDAMPASTDAAQPSTAAGARRVAAGSALPSTGDGAPRVPAGSASPSAADAAAPPARAGSASPSTAGADPAVGEDYLAAADEAGLLHRLDGLVYVAGEYREPLTGVDQCLVEYADPRLLRAAPAFLEALFARFPACAEAIVRVAGADDPHPALTPYLSYLALPVEAVRACDGTRADEPRIVLDEAREHDTAVHDWLCRAMVTAAAGRGLTTRPEAVRAAVDDLVDSPGRRSFVVFAEGHDQPFGHATLCVDAHDDPSGTDFVDLVDILVDDPVLRSTSTAALVRASARLADGLGLPLVGNVCHGLDEAGRSGAVTAALEARGWRRTHQYRQAPRRSAGAVRASQDQDQEETP
ncbi:hypothetical protein ACGFX8_23730 [Streptomyces sp. NPDC048362]|uniref:hypothetical protein n=1 Tax=Streptomyces sp. NPDC048362 TaxID=3365539 RepID=UPI003713E720